MFYFPALLSSTLPTHFGVGVGIFCTVGGSAAAVSEVWQDDKLPWLTVKFLFSLGLFCVSFFSFSRIPANQQTAS